MAHYCISGIIKLQKEFFSLYFSNKNIKYREQLSEQMFKYVAGIEEQLKKQNLSPAQLSLSSRAALFNIKGLASASLNQPHRFVEVLQYFQSEKLYFKKLKQKEIILLFSPSERLYHKIHLNNKYVKVYVSFVCKDLPDNYFISLSQLLFRKITGQPISAEIKNAIYSSEENFLVNDKKNYVAQNYNKAAQGNLFDLEEIFKQLNEKYFNNKLTMPQVRWSLRNNRRRLGFYDLNRNLLVINRLLDQRAIPQYVIEGIMHHEMLHIIHPIQHQNGRRIIHSRAFKNDEKKFKQYMELKKWLKQEFPRLTRHKNVISKT